MSLPHPHGNASGQIGNNANYDIGDTPGSVGGKFIGFGEEGTSAVANRAHWALSENIDYVYQAIGEPLAMPEIASWTVGAGGEATYTFIGTPAVWCGDAGYTGQDGLDRLFSLLDSHYNQLTDPTDGSKVVVRTVVDGSDVDQLGEGFVLTPIIKFKTVDPVTGADVTDPYTIPEATVVKVVHARESSIENLQTDSFTKIPIRIAEEVPAGVVLQDGTRPMTGNLNLDGHNLTNLVDLLGKPTATTRLRGAGAETLLLDNWGNMAFTDTRASVWLSKVGQPTAMGVNDGLVGGLSNAWLMGTRVNGNRMYSKLGVITFIDGTATIEWPNMQVLLNGDFVSIEADSTRAVTGTAQVLVIESDGDVTSKLPSAVLTTDLPIAYYLYTAGSFTTKLDIRWPISARSSAFEVRVGQDGSGNLQPGCDLPDLESAFKLIRVMALTTMMAQSYTIKVSGIVPVTETLIPTNNTRLIGEGHAVIRADHAVGSNTIDAGGSCPTMEIRDIEFLWGGTDNQDVDKCCITNLGLHSRVINCTFSKNTSANKSFYNAIGWTAPDTVHVLVENCAADVIGRLIMGASTAVPVPDLIMDSVVRNCMVYNSTATGTTTYAIDMAGAGNTVENCRVVCNVGAGFANGIRVGDRGRVSKCWVYGAEAGDGITVQTNDTGTMNSAVVEHCRSEHFANAYSSCITSGFTLRNMHVTFRGNYAGYCTSTGFNITNDDTKIGAGYYEFIGNQLDHISGGGAGSGIFLSSARLALIQGNYFFEMETLGVTVGYGTTAKIVDNDIPSFTNYAVHILSTAAAGSIIRGNRLGARGCGTTDTVVKVDKADCLIQGNRFDVLTGDGEEIAYCIKAGVANIRILDNYFGTFGSSGSGNAIVISAVSVSLEGIIIRGNTFLGDGADEIQIVRLSGCVGAVVEGNYFNGGCVVLYADKGSYSCDGTTVRGNTILGATGYQASGCFVMAVGNSDSVGIVVEGNNFINCGYDATDIGEACLLLEGLGVARGNTFNRFIGYVASTAWFCRCIYVLSGQYLIEGNTFYQDLTVLPYHMRLIDVDVTDCTIQNNSAVLLNSTTSFAGTAYFIRAADKNDTICNGNHLASGTVSGGGVVVAMLIDGDHCIVCNNRAGQFNIVANGVDSTVSGNSVPSGTLMVAGATVHPAIGTSGVSANYSL